MQKKDTFRDLVLQELFGPSRDRAGHKAAMKAASTQKPTASRDREFKEDPNRLPGAPREPLNTAAKESKEGQQWYEMQACIKAGGSPEKCNPSQKDLRGEYPVSLCKTVTIGKGKYARKISDEFVSRRQGLFGYLKTKFPLVPVEVVKNIILAVHAELVANKFMPDAECTKLMSKDEEGQAVDEGLVLFATLLAENLAYVEEGFKRGRQAAAAFVQKADQHIEAQDEVEGVLSFLKSIKAGEVPQGLDWKLKGKAWQNKKVFALIQKHYFDQDGEGRSLWKQKLKTLKSLDPSGKGAPEGYTPKDVPASAGTINVRKIVGPQLKAGGIDITSPQGKKVHMAMLDIIGKFLDQQIKGLGVGAGSGKKLRPGDINLISEKIADIIAKQG